MEELRPDLSNVDLEGQPAPERLERIVGPTVTPSTVPELFGELSDADTDVVDLAVRLAQGDAIDGFRRSELGILTELGILPQEDTDLPGIALEAYYSVWREEVAP